MANFNRELAKITSASLEIKERGILNFWIHVKYESGCCQGIGGIALDTYSKKTERRIGTAYGCEVIRQLLLCLDVNDFSEMKGKMIWVLGEGKNFGFKPKGIERLYVDEDISKDYKQVIFDEILKEFSNEF